jgi:Flp pilus assembly CpaE family ATPase
MIGQMSPPRRSSRSGRRLTVITEPANATSPGPPRASEVAADRVTPMGDSRDRSHQNRTASATRGLLVAVCGLCGGAGASTQAYLIAAAGQAVLEPGTVLVADTGGPGSRLADYAGVASPRSLTEAAGLAAASQPVGQLVAVAGDGLRVLACGPGFATDCAADGVSMLLDHARSHYALSVIDCGTLARHADQITLVNATHIVWVLPATSCAARPAGRLLDQVNPSLSAAEIVVARCDPSQPQAPLRLLRGLAAQRHAPLVLMPAVGDLAATKLQEALEVSQVSLQAIRGQLARPVR